MTKLTRKTLVISSQLPPKIGGTPQQMSMLFAEIDPASYAVYTSQQTTDPKYAGKRLTGRYHFFPSDRITGPLSLYRTVRECLRVMKDERIEVLYVPTDGGTSFSIALLASWLSSVPMVLHFLDIYRGNNYSAFRSLYAALLEALVVRRAESVIICNPAIDAEYKRRYGNDSRFVLIENSVSRARTEQAHAPFRPEPPYTIIYTGNIYWAQEESIVSMCDAVRASTLPVEFHIYTPLPPSRLIKRYAEFPRIKFLTSDPRAIAGAQEQADILFLPLAWPRESRVVTETALPGKLPEYLLSGRPILIQAPPDCYLVRYAEEERCAAVVTELASAGLEKAMRRLLTDVSYAETLIRNAFRAYEKHHDAAKNRVKFFSVLDGAS